MAKVAISVQRLTKTYKTLKAVDDVSFDVDEGGFLAFLGPNGAGKTTTINSITGLSNFQNGRISVFGLDVAADYRRARRSCRSGGRASGP